MNRHRYETLRKHSARSLPRTHSLRSPRWPRFAPPSIVYASLSVTRRSQDLHANFPSTFIHFSLFNRLTNRCFTADELIVSSQKRKKERKKLIRVIGVIIWWDDEMSESGDPDTFNSCGPHNSSPMMAFPSRKKRKEKKKSRYFDDKNSSKNILMKRKKKKKEL